jgi:MEMO1 family protein
MKKFLSVVGTLAAWAVAAQAAGMIRPAVFAGQFYDRDPDRLRAQVDWCLDRAPVPAVRPDKVLALIAPHAAYAYSAQTAACAYALVRGKPYEAVVIIGPSHQAGFEGCSIWPDGGFETPLGTAPVDSALAADIRRASGYSFVPEAFAREHSVEVQVPFVQRALPTAKIVPIVMGFQNKRTVQTLAAALAKACAGKNVLVVASTDMSHFLSKDKADALDAETISLIRSAKTETLLRKIEAGDNILCGGGPVVAAILYAQKTGPVRVEVLRHSDSADAGGPGDSVVGYMAAAVVPAGERGPEEFMLTAEDKGQLLRLARAAVEEYVTRGTVVEDRTGNPKFLPPRGVFVTLTKRGDLRGCIGFIEPVAPLSQALIRAAIYAATEDPRFPPVGAAELKGLEVEVSVLTPLKEITNPAQVQVGRHGLVVSRGGRRGLLLPQVPVENGWDRETFLKEGCLKAGLPPDAWQKGAKMEIFEAIVFRE